MAQDVKIAGHSLSPVMAGCTIIGGLAAVYFVWKQHEAAKTATSASSIDPVTGLPYSQDDVTDPLTGETYLAEAQEYGSVSAAEQATAAASSLDSTSADGTTIGNGNATSTVTTGTGYASNAAWSSAAQAGLTSIGFTSTDVAQALGEYLDNQVLPVLSDGQSAVAIVQAAISEYGPPPVGTYVILQPPATSPVNTTGTCPSGYTYSATSTGKAGQIDATGGNGYCVINSVSVPPAGHVFPAPSGLRSSAVSSTGYSLSWSPVPSASSYTVATYSSAGVLEDEFDVSGTSTKEYGKGGTGLKPGTYHTNVWANGGTGAPAHSTVYVTIK